MELNASKTALIFPGQGSQVVGMGQDLASAYPIARATYVHANMVLDAPISDISWDGPEDLLNDTYNTQPALLVHSVAALKIFKEMMPDFRPKYVAGHSLGELSALVAAGALDFPEALSLTRRRGELMKLAGKEKPGGMVAILGLDTTVVESICEKANVGDERVQIANDNCPGQIVVSGAGGALRRLIDIANAAGARKFVPLMVSIAAHSYLMAHAQEAFNEAVDGAKLRDPMIPIIGNVTAKPLKYTRDIEEDLKAQLTSRVRWTESVEYMISQGVDTFIEVGTGDVLSMLIKRISRDTTRITLGTVEDFIQFSN